MFSLKTLKSPNIDHVEGLVKTLCPRLHGVHLLLAVSAACPVTPHSHRSHRHQEDDHHIVVQHGLVGSIHGNQPSFPKRLQGLQT